MKKLAFIMLTLLLGFAVTAIATGGHDHGAAKTPRSDHPADGLNKNDAHADMAMSSVMLMLGDQVNQGVKGIAHLNDVREAMAKAGMNFTHHFMIAFVDEKTELQLEQGVVALKLTDPDGKIMNTVELIGMGGHFGADLALTKQGEYHFQVGSKLADNVTRKYHFHQTLK